MFEIPIGKALTAIENADCENDHHGCGGCIFESNAVCEANFLGCAPVEREDGKNVVFKLVDYPPKRAPLVNRSLEACVEQVVEETRDMLWGKHGECEDDET